MLLLLSLAIVILINALLFLVAYTRQSDKLTDFSYALSFIVVVVATWLFSTHQSPLLAVVITMVFLWALRLGSFLVIRIRKQGKDSRFDAIRKDFFKFLKFWLGQGAIAWVLLLPVIFLGEIKGIWTIFTSVGVTIWLIGLGIESVADAQKYRFNQAPINRGKWVKTGIWRYSRHPNYFGEITVWVGVYVTVFSSLGTIERLIGLVSPVMIFITLRFISGVPILEKSAEKRWGRDLGYRSYRKRTNLLVPFWPRND